MPTDPQAPPIPQLPPREKLVLLAKYMAVVVLLALYPVGVELWQWLRDPWDNSINWRELWDMAWKCAEPAALGCYLHYKAWLEAPPGTQLVQTTVTQTALSADPGTMTTVKTETVDVQPKLPADPVSAEPKP